MNLAACPGVSVVSLIPNPLTPGGVTSGGVVGVEPDSAWGSSGTTRIGPLIPGVQVAKPRPSPPAASSGSLKPSDLASVAGTLKLFPAASLTT